MKVKECDEEARWNKNNKVFGFTVVGTVRTACSLQTYAIARISEHARSAPSASHRSISSPSQQTDIIAHEGYSDSNRRFFNRRAAAVARRRKRGDDMAAAGRRALQRFDVGSLGRYCAALLMLLLAVTLCRSVEVKGQLLLTNVLTASPQIIVLTLTLVAA